MRLLNLAFCLLVAGITPLGGCDSEVEAIVDRTGSGTTCPQWRCGFNAAEINGHSLQTLSLNGAANADGVKIVGFLPPPLVLLGGYTLGVENDELVAKRGSQRLKKGQLVGSIILVQVELGLVLPVTILGYESVPSWADGGAPIAAYTLVYPEVASLLGVKNVCGGSLLEPLVSAATVLGGETYDDATKTVNANQSGWFTLACAGSAAAKMKLMGYAPQTNFPGTSAPSTPTARQATLKMITGDYCGGGTSYTENGTAIVWENHEGTVDWHTPGEVEAVWTASGALCLDTTRIEGAEVGCELPSCAALSLADGAWITHVVQ